MFQCSIKLIVCLFILIIMGWQKCYAQNVDSLLSIWNRQDIEASVKLEAIQQLLSTRAYFTANLDTADTLAIAQYELAKQNSANHLIDALFNRMNIAFQKGQFLNIIDLADECLNIESDYLSYEIKARILHLKAMGFEKLGHLEEAINEYEKITTFDSLSNTTLEYIYNGLGLCYYSAGNHSEAINAFQNYLETVKKGDNSACKKSIYHTNIGNVYLTRADVAKALEYYHLAVEDLKDCADKSKLIRRYANLGKAYIESKDYENALKYLNLALATPNIFQQKSTALHIRLDMANIYVEQNQLKKAENIFFTVQEKLHEVEMIDINAFYFLSYGKFKLKLKHYREAFEACEKGYRICEDGFTFGAKACADCLVEISKQRKDYESALVWYTKSKTLQDSIVNKTSANRITKLEAELQYKEKESTYEKNILSLQIKAEQEKRNKIIILGLFLMSIPIILGLIWIYHSQKKKAKILGRQKQLLEENLKNKELIAQQAKILGEQERLKLDFFANVAHEFQTPLAIINSQSNNLLTRETLSQKDRLNLGMITRNSTNLSKLTAQILDIAKSTQWKMGLEVNRFYLYEVLNPIVEEYQILAKDKNLRFDFNFNNTQEVLMITDAYKLSIIIYNLLSNAIKYSKPEGNIIVNVKALNEHLAFECIDDGIGISEKELPHIFDRFYQVIKTDNSTEQKGGFGIGLAICKEYANILKGKISVKSKINQGSKFYLEIPIKIREAGTPIKNKVLTTNLTQNRNYLVNIPNSIFTSESFETILIVEDNKDFWVYLQDLLSDSFNLVFKSNGLEALSYLENSTLPDLIITDIMMPYMDGISLIKSLKENTSLNFIPILILTARNDIKNKTQGLIANLDDYLLKPFDKEVLLARIEYLLNLSEERFGINLSIANNHNLISQKDQAWLASIEALVEASISDVELTPAKLAKEMQLSLVHLNRKLKQLIGLTLSKYISETRFRKALELLENKEVESVKALCYTVGFKTIKYFSRNFKNRFGKYPSEYL